MNRGLGMLLFLAVLGYVWARSPPAFSSQSGKPHRSQPIASVTRENTELHVSKSLRTMREDSEFRHNLSEK